MNRPLVITNQTQELVQWVKNKHSSTN